MKNIFSFFFLLFAFSIMAQENKIFPEAELMKKNKVKSCRIFVKAYDPAGIYVPKLDMSFVLKFDTLGRILKSTNYIYIDTNFYNETFYFYNQKSQCIADTIKGTDPAKNYGTRYTYDDNGRVIQVEACEPFHRIKRYESGGSDYLKTSGKKIVANLVYEYKDEKTIIITNPCCWDNEEDQKCVLKLDKNKNVTEQTYSFWGKKYSSTVYSYDKENKLTSSILKSKGKTVTSKFEYYENGLIKNSANKENSHYTHYDKELTYTYEYY